MFSCRPLCAGRSSDPVAMKSGPEVCRLWAIYQKPLLNSHLTQLFTFTDNFGLPEFRQDWIIPWAIWGKRQNSMLEIMSAYWHLSLVALWTGPSSLLLMLSENVQLELLCSGVSVGVPKAPSLIPSTTIHKQIRMPKNFCFILFCFWNRVSLYSPSRSITCFVDQAGPKLISNSILSHLFVCL